jgi:hypothetical protein
MFLWKKESDVLKIRSSVNVKNSNDQNSLHLIIEYLSNENVNEIFKMMGILISYGCNPNSPDKDRKTPFYKLVEKLPDLINPHGILDYFVRYSEVDFYTHRGSELVDMISDKYPFDIPNEEEFSFTHENMINLLEIGDINKFETKFQHYEIHEHGKITFEHCSKYLEIAVDKSLINIVDLLIAKDIDVNRTSKDSKEKIPPLFLAYKNANLGIFKSFLMTKSSMTGAEVNMYYDDEGYSRTLLHHFFCGFDSKSKTVELTVDQKKCFDLLLSDPRCDRKYLNIEDKRGYSAIYYTVAYGIDYMTKKLLQEGAYIYPVITNIRKGLFKEFLDSCVTSNDEFYDSNEFRLSVNYKFLMPSPDVKNKINNRYSSCHQEFKADINDKNSKERSPEMYPLKKLTENDGYRHFIMHPVISSFVFLKWKKIRFSLYLNLFLTLFFILTIVPFIVIHRKNEYFVPKHLILQKLSGLSLFMLFIREILQFRQAPRRYFKWYSNYLDIILISLSASVILEIVNDRDHLRIFHTLIILLSTWECFNLLGFLPLVSVSLHIKMFRKVFMTFLQSLAIYSVIVLGFALSFHTLHGDRFQMDLQVPGNNTDDMIETPTNSSRSERFNNFYSLVDSIIKSFVMLTGELEASNIYYDGYTYIGLFMLFLFVVTIVLYNLLNALAISNTQEIISDAKLIDVNQRILSMYQHEMNVFNGRSALSKFLQEIFSLFPDTIPGGMIYVEPISNRGVFKSNGELITNDFLPKYCRYFCRDMTISRDIVNDMCNLLVKKREAHAEDNIRYFMKVIHRSMNKLNEKMDEIKSMQMTGST